MPDSKRKSFKIVAPSDAAYLSIIDRLVKRKLAAHWDNMTTDIYVKGAPGLVEGIAKRFGATCEECTATEYEPKISIPTDTPHEDENTIPVLPVVEGELIEEKDQALMSDDAMQIVGTTCHPIPYNELIGGGIYTDHEHTTGVDPFFLTGE